MDFPNLKKTSFKNITFNLSDLFQKDFNPQYVMKKSSFSESVYDLDIYFSVEEFTELEAQKIQTNFDGEIDLLNAINDNYILKREESIYNHYSSIKKIVPKTVKYPGYIQVVEGSSSKNSATTAYFISTLKIADKYYVFQLIGIQKNMGYLHDDFISLLSSVKKNK